MHVNLSPAKILVAALVIFCLLSSPVFAENTTHILVITSSNDTPYQEAVSGFKEQISAQTKIKFTQLDVTRAQSSGIKEIERLKPDLIYALGMNATQWVSHETSSIPIVATMILKEEVFKKAPNMTGVSLSHPLKTQFQWLKKFFPQKKTVAILFNPSENTAIVQAASVISQQQGFNLVAIPVETPKKLPLALKQLESNVEIMLSIPDETVMSINTAKELLLASFGNKVPLIGLSDNWVKSGAFYALSWDYEDLGRQCATLAQKILAGTPVALVKPEYPRKVTYTINTKIAEHMNMDIPQDLLRNAKIIFD
jgi:putative tryptophan/tyrosine transport system substrate-binding protein